MEIPEWQRSDECAGNLMHLNALVDGEGGGEWGWGQGMVLFGYENILFK